MCCLLGSYEGWKTVFDTTVRSEADHCVWQASTGAKPPATRQASFFKAHLSTNRTIRSIIQQAGKKIYYYTGNTLLEKYIARARKPPCEAVRKYPTMHLA